MSPKRHEVSIERVEARAYRVPTETPESDGTLEWNATTLVAVHAHAGGLRGFGYTYGAAAVAAIVGELAPAVVGRDALAVEGAWNALSVHARNLGRPGAGGMAIAAIDAALWDLKGKLLGLPLVRLLGDVRDRAPVYGSGGFTSYDEEALCRQLVGWAEEGIPRVKMKVGRAPDDDPRRVAAARRALGGGPELMVDANGAYHAAQARALAAAFAREGVTWLEEPVSSDDLDGLRRVRDEAPPGLAIAAGEYGDSPGYFRRMLAAGSVDVLQADATRCLGPTGFLAAGRLAQAFGVPLSAHCAPSLHAHLACAVTPLVHVEWFFDHVRLESRLFEGFVPAKGGFLEPDRTRAGIGIELKEQEAEEYRVVS